MTYTYLACDLRTNAVLAELPLRAVTFGHDLNEVGEFNGSLDLLDAGTRLADLRRATAPGRTALYIDCDGVLVWGGIIWKRQFAGGVLTLSGNGFLSYLARVRISASTFFRKADQFDIVRTLVRQVAARPGGDIGIVHSTNLSGVTRDVSYNIYDHTPVLEAMRALAALVNGFDFAINVAYDTNRVPFKYLMLGSPTLGRTKEHTNLLVEYPGNIGVYDWPEEGDRVVSTVHVRSDLTDGAPPVTRANTDLIVAGYPLLEDEQTASASGSTQALNEYAAAYLAAYGAPVILPSFTIPVGVQDPVLGSYAPGDYFRVRLTDPQWLPAAAGGKPGFDGHMRMVKLAVTVDDNGAGQAVTLTMNPLIGYSGGGGNFAAPTLTVRVTPSRAVAGEPVTITLIPAVDPAQTLATLTLTMDGEPVTLSDANTFTYTAT